MQQLDTNSTGSEASLSSGSSATRNLEIAIPFTIVSGIFSLFGGLSNLVLLIVLIKYVQITKKSYLYMCSLFLSEVLYNFLFQPHVAYNRFPSSVRTAAGSKFLHFCSFTFLLTGVLSLFCATLDKYIFIRYPFFYASRLTEKKAILTVVIMWFFCIFFGVLQAVLVYRNFSTFFSVIMFVLFLLTICLQVMIFIVAKKQTKRINLANRVLEYNPQGENGGDVQRTVSSSNKAAKTIGLMLVIYMCSWLPSTVHRMHFHWVRGSHTTYVLVAIWLNTLVQVHSCVNPYIFVLRTKEVKHGVQNMLRRFGVNRVIPFLSDHRASQVHEYHRRAINNLCIGSADVNGNQHKKNDSSTSGITSTNTNAK